jgi:hypothetical protein
MRRQNGKFTTAASSRAPWLCAIAARRTYKKTAPEGGLMSMPARRIS